MNEDNYPKKFNEILKYIVYKCREMKSPIAESLISYLLKILNNDNTNEFYFMYNNEVNYQTSKEIVEKVMELLHKNKDGVLETIKLQVLYELSNIEEEEKIKTIKKFYDVEISKILNEIKSFESDTRKEYDTINIYKKIFSFLLIKTRQATVDSINNFIIEEDEKKIQLSTEKEIYAAFDNILPKSALSPFIALNADHKESNLNELANIVLGIRLLNKQLEKGGIGLLSLEDIKLKLSKNLYNSIKEFHEKIYDTCMKYTRVFESIDTSLAVEEDEINVIEKLKKYIVFYHQICTYLSIMMDDINSSQNTIATLNSSYFKEIQFLIELVEKKSALSKSQVYPQFEALSKIYSKYQEQFFIANIRENVFNKLLNFVSNSSIPIKFDIAELGVYKNEKIKEKQEEIFTIESGYYQKGVSIILPHNSVDFMHLKLDYQGFCLVTLINKDGLLVNGKPTIIAKYKDKNFVFYGNNEVQDFIDDPDKYLDLLKIYLQKNSHLINLLNASEEFPDHILGELFRNKESLMVNYKNNTTKVDAVVQTSLHPDLEEVKPELLGKFKFDRDYVWNEWELKKLALQKADILKKTTKSVQTNLSHYRRENESQIYEKVDTGINTNVSQGTNLSIRRNYVSDLRDYSKKLY